MNLLQDVEQGQVYIPLYQEKVLEVAKAGQVQKAVLVQETYERLYDW
jgi:hypothetical protein